MDFTLFKKTKETETEAVPDPSRREFVKNGLIALSVGGLAALLSKLKTVEAVQGLNPTTPLEPRFGGTGLSTLSGSASKALMVKSDESGFEFTTPATGTGDKIYKANNFGGF